MGRHVGLLLKQVICILLVLCMTGCWNRRELNTLAIVMGIGLDKPETPGKIQMTAQIAKPSEMKTSAKEGGGGGSNNAYLNLRNTDDTVFSTIRGFTHESGRKLLFPHNQVLIFGRGIAEEGIQKYIDFFVRDHETRFTVWVLVSKDTADGVLNVNTSLNKIPATNISDLVKAQAATSQTSDVKLKEFLIRLMSKTTAPIAPFIEVSGEGEKKAVSVSGTAVFKRDKLVGELNKKETRGLLWVIKKVKSGIIEVDSPDGKGKVSLEIIKASSKITPEIKGEKINIKVDIKEEGNLGAQSSPADLTMPKEVDFLEKEAEAAIRDEIMAALIKSRELNADVFGFGDVIHKKYPDEWKELESQWDEVFPSLELEVNVEAELHLTGEISGPPVPE